MAARIEPLLLQQRGAIGRVEPGCDATLQTRSSNPTGRLPGPLLCPSFPVDHAWPPHWSSFCPPPTLGCSRYHLTVCQWRRGDVAAAHREAEESPKAYSQAPDEDGAPAPLLEQTRHLLADLKEDKSPPPFAKVDAATALATARTRFRAREILAMLPLEPLAAPFQTSFLEPVFESLGKPKLESLHSLGASLPAARMAISTPQPPLRDSQNACFGTASM